VPCFQKLPPAIREHPLQGPVIGARVGRDDHVRMQCFFERTGRDWTEVAQVHKFFSIDLHRTEDHRNGAGGQDRIH